MNSVFLAGIHTFAGLFVVAEDEKGGGSGANFLVKWKSDTEVNPPIIESIMIGAQSSQGISFTSRGRANFEKKTR
jgi:hypothetical protein